MMAFGMEPTEEQKAAFERQRMHQVEALHGIMRLFDELNEDQLVSLRNLVWGCQHPQGTTTLSYYEGIIRHSLSTRFGICASCNKDHSKELEADLGNITHPDEMVPGGMTEPSGPTMVVAVAEDDDDDNA